MNVKTYLALSAGLIALAACGGPEKKEGGNASGEAAAAGGSGSDGGALAGGSATLRLEPGEWETIVESVSVEAPNMPQQARDMMAKAMGGSKMSVRHCVTPEEANRPSGDLFSGRKDGNCTSKDFSVSGGRVQGTITCNDPQAGAVNLVMDGRFDPRSYTVSQTMKTDAAGQTMTIKSRVSGRRVGECSAATKEG